MLFNSIDFAIFLPVVFLVYWLFGKQLTFQNYVLLAASYFFYACWDYRFLVLILFSTTTDFIIGQKIFEAKSLKLRRTWLWISIIIGLGLLGLFKYYNFFAESFSSALLLMGIKVNYGLLQVILPLGISFYTFHGLSYVIDIYNKKIGPENNFIRYALFVSFFPLLVAGPIERATHLLPQLGVKRKFDYAKAVDGLRQILWGLFKKVVIADNCADYANLIFNNYPAYQGSTLVVGVFFFAVQIYCDFSGYSDIAIGTARLFGIDLLRNFSFPYFARSIPEFWRRWHISLTSWFRDYVFIPLGGSRVSKFITIRNIFIVFLLSGLWHGANFTFIVWGLLHALYMLPGVLFRKGIKTKEIVAKGKWLPSPGEAGSMIITFMLVLFAWIFFRSVSLEQAFDFVRIMFTRHLVSVPETRPYFLLLGVFLFFVLEWLGREDQYAIQSLGLKWNRPLRWSFYLMLSMGIFIYLGREQAFIYFQF
jgi:D-alanyl-lipoteichoic acid acyltransferase DltB (MBOAT superfamily)